MHDISWAHHLVLAISFFVFAWGASTALPERHKDRALLVVTGLSFALAWSLALWTGLLLAVATLTLARWVYRQSEAVYPTALYHWL